MQQKIVITGAPGTGKTSVIEHLEDSGYVCQHEIIRAMTLEAKKETASKLIKSNPLTFVSDPLKFNKQILKGRLNQFKNAATFKEPLVFFDRAIPDVLAYMDFFEQTYDHNFTKTCQDHTYSSIFLLPPWKEIYKSDNERFETFDEAIEIHQHLERTYKKFGYNPISVPFAAVEQRVQFILNMLKNL